MPTNENQFEQYQDWASAGGGEGDPVEDTGTIEDWVDALMADLGNFYTDPTNLPATAGERQNGAGFLNVNDLHQYLQDGGLVHWDEDGNPVPNNIVHIVKRFDDVQQTHVYDVWIDDQTP